MKKFSKNKKIAFALWFVLSVLFLGTPSPLMVLLPGVFIVDILHMANTYVSGAVIVLFGSLLNLGIYLWVAGIIDKKGLFIGACKSCKEGCSNLCTKDKPEDEKTKE